MISQASQSKATKKTWSNVQKESISFKDNNSDKSRKVQEMNGSLIVTRIQRYHHRRISWMEPVSQKFQLHATLTDIMRKKVLKRKRETAINHRFILYNFQRGNRCGSQYSQVKHLARVNYTTRWVRILKEIVRTQRRPRGAYKTGYVNVRDGGRERGEGGGLSLALPGVHPSRAGTLFLGYSASTVSPVGSRDRRRNKAKKT